MNITNGILRVKLRYCYVRNGTTYYQRAIPGDLQDRYGMARVKVKLEPSDLRTIARQIGALNRAVEAEWQALRHIPDATPKTIRGQAEDLLKAWGLEPGSATNDDDAMSLFYDSLDRKRDKHAKGDEEVYRDALGSEYLGPIEVEAARLLDGKSKPRLTDALDVYLKVSPKRNSTKFCAFTRASFAKLVAAIGDKPIDSLARADGHAFVSTMMKQGLASGSVRRLLNTLRAVMNTYIREEELDRVNPFANVPIPDEGEDTEHAVPYSANELAKLVTASKDKDDDPRWLVALIADTGARLAEIAGLALDDIDLDAPVPHIVIKRQPWRRLKNTQSARTVPLLGSALWAARRVKETAKEGQRFAFPRYTTAKRTNANSASATLNKWIKEGITLDHTVHELRHTIADRLREVQCPADVRLAIGGWSVKGVGEGYGDGYSLRVMAEWLRKVLPK
ncbi:MAG: tyrosine-type recombinase/integrase [Pseudorhodobacter sp.]|nr:tyrosine-type recombinase/integrase [Rhizobacter sp.]